MKLSIVIPMKNPECSKTRLAKVLNPSERKRLALYLFEKNLGFFRQMYPQYNLLVVTESQEIQQIAESYGAEVLREGRQKAPRAEQDKGQREELRDGAREEQQQSGLNAAVSQAARYNADRGFDSQLVIPGDIQELDCDEIETLLNQRVTERSVIVCPSYDGGTNAIMTTPPDVMPFCFGPNSSRKHLLAAFEAGLHTRRVFLESLSHDIDRPEDLSRVDSEFEKISA